MTATKSLVLADDGVYSDDGYPKIHVFLQIPQLAIEANVGFKPSNPPTPRSPRSLATDASGVISSNNKLTLLHGQAW